MQTKNLTKAGILAVVLVVTFMLCYEGYWRSKGFTATFNDDKALWAVKRSDVYKPAKEATVFIGSSRIKFDLDIPEWRKLTGEDAVQLSLVGTSPLQLLHDLAEDTLFNGKLVVDVTEVLFFSQNPFFHKSANEAIGFYKKLTPSEKLSAYLGLGLESQLSFLEERKFSLNVLLNDLDVPNRAGVFVLPSFPKGFEVTTYDRQTYMSDQFLADTNLINTQTNIWKMLIMGDKTPPVAGEALQNIIAGVKTDVDKIKARGGKVIFTRTPSSGLFWEAESVGFPRQKYWDALLTSTHTDGIHFTDYSETKDMICPEWSHLSPTDAVKYTQHLVKNLCGRNWF